MTNGIVVKPPSEITIDAIAPRSGSTTFIDRFYRNGAGLLLKDLMTRARCPNGSWMFRTLGTFKSCGNTKPVQVRRVETTGVVIWLKPGSNDTGVRGLLVVTKDKNMTPEEMYRRLKPVAVQLYGGKDDTDVPLPDLNLEDNYVRLLLKAVKQSTDASTDWPSVERFIGELIWTPGLNTEDSQDLMDQLETLVDRGLLADAPGRNYYRITAAGMDVLYGVSSIGDTEIPQPEEEETTVPTTAIEKTPAPPAPTPAPPAPAPTGDVLSLLAGGSDKLKRLMELPGLVEACRAEQVRLSAEIDRLIEELDVAQKREHALVDGLDLNALRKLLEG